MSDSAQPADPGPDHAILALRPPGQIIDANARACEYLGYSHAELVMLHFGAVAPNAPFDRCLEQLERSPTREIRFQAEFRSKHGTVIPMKLHITEVRVEGNPVYVAWVRPLHLADPLQEGGKQLDAAWRWADDLAHRLNNLLTIVQVHASFLMAEKPLDPESKESMLEIYQAVMRGADLSHQLALLARSNQCDVPER